MDGIEAITFDFGNTLVPFPAAPMDKVVRLTAEMAADLVGCPVGDFVERLGRGAPAPVRRGGAGGPGGRHGRPGSSRPGQAAGPPGAAGRDPMGRRRARGVLASRGEIEAILEAYAADFVVNTPVPPEIGPMLARLARSRRLAIVSNWPLALAVDRFVEAAGWLPYLSAVVVSHRVGAIKPRPEIFEVAARELGVPSGPRILHAGDDLGADVVGAHGVGWKAAWVKVKPEDSPLPVAPPAPASRPDIEIDSILDLEAALGLPGAPSDR